jgi:hypothetical protein
LLPQVVANVILIAAAGFVTMLACSTWAVTRYRRRPAALPGASAKDKGSGKKRHAAGHRAGTQTGSG